MIESRYARYKKIFAGVPKPFAFLDLDLLRENIKDIQDRSRGKNVRIASKSIRSVPVLRLILESGEPFRGVMCYSPLEALFLAEQGFDDLLIAYPAWEKRHSRSRRRPSKCGKVHHPDGGFSPACGPAGAGGSRTGGLPPRLPGPGCLRLLTGPSFWCSPFSFVHPGFISGDSEKNP